MKTRSLFLWLTTFLAAAANAAPQDKQLPVIGFEAPGIDLKPAAPKPRYGWAGADDPQMVVTFRAEFAAQLPPYQIPLGLDLDGPAANYVTLWTFVKERNNRQHRPVIPQEIGDCVSHGWGHGLGYALGAHLVMEGKDATLTFPYQPYLYGAGRVWIGKGRLGNSDGSLGGWQAAAVQDATIGVLPENAAGVPPYSGDVAKAWGFKGPPANLREVAKAYRADCRLVTTWPQAVAAISSGYPIPVCSQQGFQMKAVERNGRLEGVPQGSWPHCMCFIGVDNRPGREALYCLNSWGPRAHGNPADYARLDGAPPGGFWVPKATAERMLGQQDSYAVSFDGFSHKGLAGKKVSLGVRVPQTLWFAGCESHTAPRIEPRLVRAKSGHELPALAP